MTESLFQVNEMKAEDKHIEDALISSGLEKKDSSIAAETNTNVDDYISKFLEMSEDARADDQKEKQMTLKEGVKTFPKAIAWSVVLSTALIMEGYDTCLLASFYAFDGFKKQFGDYYPDLGEYQVPARWQTGLSNSYYCGQLIGLWLASIFADRIGYRKTLMPALAMCVGLIFIQFFCPKS